MADDHPTADPEEDEYGTVPTTDEPAGEDESPPDERDDSRAHGRLSANGPH